MKFLEWFKKNWFAPYPEPARKPLRRFRFRRIDNDPGCAQGDVIVDAWDENDARGKFAQKLFANTWEMGEEINHGPGVPPP